MFPNRAVMGGLYLIEGTKILLGDFVVELNVPEKDAYLFSRQFMPPHYGLP